MARMRLKGYKKPYSSFSSVTSQLLETLSEEQSIIYRDCESNYCELDAETIHFYYEAGFSDAIRFVMGWKDGLFNKLRK